MATGRDRDDEFLSMSEPITLRRFLTRYAEPGGLDPNLIFLIEDIASACRVIGNRLRNAAFEGNHGLAGDTNVQGEDQKKLDVIADEVLVVSQSFSEILQSGPDRIWVRKKERAAGRFHVSEFQGVPLPQRCHPIRDVFLCALRRVLPRS